MKTIKINVYSFNELPADIQDKIILNWRNDEQYFWADENSDSLSAFAEMFRIKINNYDYGYRNYINAAFDLDSDLLELSGLQLSKFLWNNYKKRLFKPKYYYHNGKRRDSRILLHNDCVLTGYYMDNALLDPIYQFMNKPYNINFEDLLNNCLNEWLDYCRKDYEYWISRESIIEDINSNDYLFLENGEISTKLELMAA